MAKSITPRAAATLLGVSESTVRRWCDAGLVPTSRTSGGHRRIDRGSLLAFAREQGLAALETGPMTTAGDGGRLARAPELARRLYDVVVAGDEVQARDFGLALVSRTGEAAMLCDDVIAPVMHRIGDEWARGSLRIFREHAATQAVLATLAGALEALAAVPSDAPVAVCAALPGDPYALGPAMCGLMLHAAGFRTIRLGPDTPVAEILDAADELGARLIAVSVGVPPRAIDDLAALCRTAARRRIAVALGGRELSPALRRQLEPDFFGDTMAHLATFAGRLREPAPPPDTERAP